MEKIEERMEILLTASEKEALRRLSEKSGVSMGHVIRSLIRGSAQRRKVWRREC